VRSLEALYIYEIHPKAFRAHPAVKAFYDGIANAAFANTAQPAEDAPPPREDS
jgi:hypothetical protein